MDKTNENWKYAEKASASIDRLNELTEELLDLSRIQNGKLDLKLSEFDFNAMLDMSIEGVQVNSPKHRIIKTGHVDGNISGDKERLKQVVINLLTNAVKYAPDSQDILMNVMQGNKEVTVSVQDKGIGIRKENIGKIFDRYYREEDRSKHFPGLGIGLTICHDIIAKHHGKIWADSEENKGSTFYFTIPT
jgi:signal transduction histidine kinase